MYCTDCSNPISACSCSAFGGNYNRRSPRAPDPTPAPPAVATQTVEGDAGICQSAFPGFCDWPECKCDPAATPAPVPAPISHSTIHVECRECLDCDHTGINDSHPTDALCNSCEWSGPSPKEDHCPECHKDGTMTVACPKCSGRYITVAEAQVSAPAPAGVPTPNLKEVAHALETAARFAIEGIKPTDAEVLHWREIIARWRAASPAVQAAPELRMLTEAEIWALWEAQRYPGTVRWAGAIQRKFCAVNGLTIQKEAT